MYFRDQTPKAAIKPKLDAALTVGEVPLRSASPYRYIIGSNVSVNNLQIRFLEMLTHVAAVSDLTVRRTGHQFPGR